MARTSCPPTSESDTGTQMASVSTDGESESQFSCPARWNWEKMRRDLKHILTVEEKKFIRFRAPVERYTVSEGGARWRQTELATWIWVSERFKYMLYYPQNFQTLSLGTTDIIAENMENDDIRIDCSHCGNSSAYSCGVGYFELMALLLNVTEPLGEEWKYLCVEVDGGLSDIVSDYPPRQELQMLNTRDFALPDVLYHARFLKRYFTFCTFFSLKCKNVTNYFCYDTHGNCAVKEVLSHYSKIIYLAVLMWLFFPLLVYYLPSSKRIYSHNHIDGMFPTYKRPVYFGRCIQKYFLCYHTSIGDRHAWFLVRARRALGFFLLATLSFRFLSLPTYQFLSWTLFFLFLAAALWPDLISTHIQAEVPECFPLFRDRYPEGIIKWHGSRQSSVEYQKLAYIMLERMYMSFDGKFWTYIFQNCFRHLRDVYNQQATFLPLWIIEVIFSALEGIVILSFSFIIVAVYFILPMPYFIKELFRAISSGVSQQCSSIWGNQGKPILFQIAQTLLAILHASLLTMLLPYLIITLYSFCLLVTEITIFTYIGSTIAADKVLHYFVLIFAFGSALYAMIHSVHKLYSGILKDTVSLMENDNEFNIVQSRVAGNQTLRLTIQKTAAGGVELVGIAPAQFSKQLYVEDDFVCYISSGLYFHIVERIQPVHRQVLFVFVKLFLMLFFINISMWVKNVYKQESMVWDIFLVAGDLAVYFIPTALQILSSQRQFGGKNDAQQKTDIVAAVMDYVEKQ